MVPLTQVARKTGNHTFNYSHLSQVRDMKVDFEMLFKIRFSQTLFQTKIFRQYQQFEANNHGMLEIKPCNENQEYLVHSLNYKILTHREV
jgi:hypothetical protein